MEVNRIFTCIYCQVGFPTGEQQREHYRSDWHRYNLKRRSAELPMISFAEFERKVAENNAKSSQADNINESFYCDSCKKGFTSKNTFSQHLLSKKHVQNQSKQPSFRDDPSKSKISSLRRSVSEMKISEFASEEEIARIVSENIANAPRLLLTECLFCEKEFSTLEENLSHMTACHSFYIPDLDYLSDLEGLLKYLGEQIAVFNCCIYCNERCRAYKSIEAVRQHMVDKGHCRIYSNSDEELEIYQFYDYSEFYESDDEDTDGALNKISFSHPYITVDESEMILPSGVSIGNRIYKTYYKQRLSPSNEHESFAIKKLHDHYKTLGWASSPDSARMASIQRKQQERASKFALDVGVRNSGLQKHFRAQIL